MTEELPRVPTYPSMEPVADPRRPGQDSRTRLTPAVPPPDYGDYPDRDFDNGGTYPGENYAGAGYEGYDQGFGGDIGRELDADRGDLAAPALDPGYDTPGYDTPGFDDLDGGLDRGFGDDLQDGPRGDLDGDLEDDLDGDLDGDLDRERDTSEGDESGEPDEEGGSRSVLREWLVMAGQLALGVLGGAAVWLGFNWLWGALPQAALVVALVVIAGMVFIVRKIRKAEDLQTTVYAVLVGLLATVSPAALLLLNR